MKDVEERAVADVLLQHGGGVMFEHARDACVVDDGVVCVEVALHVGAHFVRIPGEDERVSVGSGDAVVRANRRVTGQRQHRPLLAQPFAQQRRSFGRERSVGSRHRYFGAGPFSSAFASRIVIESIDTGSSGRSLRSRLPPTIASATSIPFVT